VTFPFFVAARYLLAKKAHTAVNVISLIAMIGIGVSAMALVVVLSVFNGITSLVTSMYSSLESDLLLQAREGKVFRCDGADYAWLAAQPEVLAIGRTLEENALFGYQDRTHLGTLLGVDDGYVEMMHLAEHCIDGEFRLQRGSQALLMPAAGMTYMLGAHLAQFEGISVYMPNRTARNWLDPTTAFRKKIMGWTGIVTVHADFDTKNVLAPLHFVQKLLDYDTCYISSLAINIREGARLTDLKKRLDERFTTQCRILEREEQNATLYRTMHSERLIVIIILALILLIAMFNVVGSLSMLLIEKKNDIYTFTALGATPTSIRTIFRLEGLFLSLLGGTVGMLLGLVLSFLQQHFGFVSLGDVSSFVIKAYPVEVRALDLVGVFLLLLVLGLIASLLTVRNISAKRV